MTVDVIWVSRLRTTKFGEDDELSLCGHQESPAKRVTRVPWSTASVTPTLWRDLRMRWMGVVVVLQDKVQ